MTLHWAVGRDKTDELLASLPVPRPVTMPYPPVYGPSVDSAVLCRNVLGRLLAEPTRYPTVTELCAGSGIASLYAAQAGARVTAVDDTAAAAHAIEMNASANGLAIEVRRADVTDRLLIPPADLVAANPPYIPEQPDPAGGDAWTDGHAWNGGTDGRSVLDSIIAALPALVAPGGTAILVHSDVAGIDQTLADLSRNGFDATVADELDVEFGPIMTERSGWLEQRGLIEPGARTERLVAIHADRRPGPPCITFP